MELRGDLEHDGNWLGFYWTSHARGHLEVYPTIMVGVGDWSEGAAPESRLIFGVEFNKEAESFRLLDLASHGDKSVAVYLDRLDVLDTPFAQDAFAMTDAVFMKDSRMEEWHS
ncbi:hypothetical protein AIOL_004608 [Candidatus Rhodobacter oscarellae]|uniref:Uncharacterized protein n=1 Tax=Candidatus Rhodobacter oscarellae TaxID=1675527 RepID=A0A0J9EAJ2_9RHOB|nr:hypothetical protein AIOL_004608 [Candidatus Rhodobacter lobularis]